MKTALILIDLQNDYLASPGLEPSAYRIIANAAALLEDFRTHRAPVIHVRTSVTRKRDHRMPHWREHDKWICEVGTPGHDFPAPLAPQRGETIIDKQFFSAFSVPAMDKALKKIKCDSLILAGVHVHACIRATALDAYARRLQVFVAEEACGSDDPVHAAITRRYLRERGVRFIRTVSPNGTLLLRSPHSPRETSEPAIALRKKPVVHFPPAPKRKTVWIAQADSAASVLEKSQRLNDQWTRRPATTPAERAAVLRRVADNLLQNEKKFASDICRDVGKPIAMARGEVRRSAALLRATADLEAVPLTVPTATNASCAYRPLGIVAAITPWNNPLAIAVGKIAPAFFYDNAVLWKPAPAATMIAWRFYDLWQEAGGSLVELAIGDEFIACQAAGAPPVSGITITGSEAAGLALQEIAARRRVPFQAELGGNNAAILWRDADIESACSQVAAAAFGFAGQRCTADRRVIVPSALFEGIPSPLIAATRYLAWGNPWKEATQIGPVISRAKAAELAALCKRAKKSGLQVIAPHEHRPDIPKPNHAAYFPPTIILCPDPAHEIVQEESFGPILVVQPADSFDHAMQLLNGVRQGLVAALFSNDPALQNRFLREAQAGILKINQATADADAVSPFGGWKASGVGRAEHGIADREFFTRLQTIYTA